ncbi:MAG TPA: TetR/AcrR family transcriptional regulator [Microlunatus sp.]|nr:TetR/AcrR family transcriptional regulator [Microlunatus sp.]
MVRATPLPPDERRAAIIAATVPLLRERGREVSTRDIAEAAGIAEGTIFRVFSSKDELIDAVLDDALDPGASYRAMAAIDPALPLEERIAAAVAIIQDRMHHVFGLMHAVGFRPPGGSGESARPRAINRQHDNAPLVALLAPDTARLKIAPERAASMLSALVLALSHPMLRGDCAERAADPSEITDIFLYGITTASEGA